MKDKPATITWIQNTMRHPRREAETNPPTMGARVGPIIVTAEKMAMSTGVLAFDDYSSQGTGLVTSSPNLRFVPYIRKRSTSHGHRRAGAHSGKKPEYQKSSYVWRNSTADTAYDKPTKSYQGHTPSPIVFTHGGECNRPGVMSAPLPTRNRVLGGESKLGVQRTPHTVDHIL
jgi:hypothetical protein